MKTLDITLLLSILFLFSTTAIAQNVGVGQSTPDKTLHVTPIVPGDDPVRIDGLNQAGVPDSTFLVVDPQTGLVKYILPEDAVRLLGTPPVEVDNGLNIDPTTGKVQVGGFLVEPTTTTLGGSPFTYDLDGPGDFFIRDNGSPLFAATNFGRIGIGNETPLYKLDVEGEVTSRSNNAFRLRSNSRSVILRNDENAYYTLISDTPDAGWNSLRPIKVMLDNGNVYMSNSTTSFIHATGRVGIGTTLPAYKLHVIGEIKSNGITETSDVRFKKDITNIERSLDKLMLLRGVNYTWKKEEYPEMAFKNGVQLGVIAQEIETVFPELVSTDDEGYKSVDYSHLVPVLIEAIKELNIENEQLETKVNEMNSDLESIKAHLNISNE